MDVVASIQASVRAGFSWLQGCRDLLPDALFFWNCASYITCGRGVCSPYLSGGLTEKLVLPWDYCAVGRSASDLIPKLPLDPMSLDVTKHDTVSSLENGVDPPLVNRILVEASEGHLSDAAMQWLGRSDLTGYALTHQLLAHVLLSARRGATERTMVRAVAVRTLLELCTKWNHTYVDLTAQRVAFLALAGCGAKVGKWVLELIRLQSQDGSWPYFEHSDVDPLTTFLRVYEGRSPMLQTPVWRVNADPVIEAAAIDHAHKGHATAVSVMGLACFLRSLELRRPGPVSPSCLKYSALSGPGQDGRSAQ